MTRDEFVKLLREGFTLDIPAYSDILAAFDAQAAEVEALRAERDSEEQISRSFSRSAKAFEDRALLAESLLAEAVGALRPFATFKIAEQYRRNKYCGVIYANNDSEMTVADFDAARATLAKIAERGSK
jgi:hypothetical protein